MDGKNHPKKRQLHFEIDAGMQKLQAAMDRTAALQLLDCVPSLAVVTLKNCTVLNHFEPISDERLYATFGGICMFSAIGLSL